MCCSNFGSCSGNYCNNSKINHKKSCNSKGYCKDYCKGCNNDYNKGYSDDYSTSYYKDDCDKNRYCWDPCEMKIRKAYWAGYRAGYRDGYQVGCYDAPFCCHMNEMYDEL